jgi:hypothetical protein
MYGILNATDADDVPIPDINDPRIISVNKKNVDEPCLRWPELSLCRPMPSSQEAHDFLYLRLNCFTELRSWLKSEVSNRTTTKNVDVIIIAHGSWETVVPWQCAFGENKSRDFDLYQNDAIDLLSQFEGDTTVIWRTAGYTGKPETMNTTLQLNLAAIQRIDNLNNTSSAGSKFSYLDWNRAIASRSIGNKRIAGDIPAHFGLEPRIVLLQMITNRLREDGVF